MPSGRTLEKRKRIETVIGSANSAWYFAIAFVIIAWMAFDLGSLVMVLSKVGMITNPELTFAVVSLVTSELLPAPDEVYGRTR